MTKRQKKQNLEGVCLYDFKRHFPFENKKNLPFNLIGINIKWL